MVFSFMTLLCLAWYSHADNGAVDKTGTYETNILLELLGIKQLVNQESIYRLDLERQIRELRSKSERGATGMTFSKDDLNAMLRSLKKSIVSEVETSFAQHMGKILPFLYQMERSFDAMDEQIITFNKSLGKLDEKDDIGRTSS